MSKNEIPKALQGFFSDNGNLIARPEFKSISELESAIAKNKSIEIVNKIAEIIANYQPWLFFDEYQDWILQCEKINVWNELALKAANESDVEFTALELPNKPVQPATVSSSDILAPYQITLFKRERFKAAQEAKVTISTGKTFDADEDSIIRLMGAILATELASDDHIIEWSTADVGTGVMVNCTKAEIKEAQQAAVMQLTEIWRIKDLA